MSHENSWRVIYFEVWNHLHEKGRSFCSTVDDGERFSQGSILIPEANFTVLTSISGWQRSEDKPFVSNCQEASLMWKNMKKPWFLDVSRVPRVPISSHLTRITLTNPKGVELLADASIRPCFSRATLAPWSTMVLVICRLCICHMYFTFFLHHIDSYSYIYILSTVFKYIYIKNITV